MRELFVYYRVSATHASAAEAEVRELQRDVRAAIPGLSARWMRRLDEPGSLQTWMEIYAFDSLQQPSGVGPELQAEIEALAARRLTHIEGSRIIEAFAVCAS